MPIIGGPSVDALIACSSCGSFPDGENVVRENEYLPSIGSTFASIREIEDKTNNEK